MADTAAPTLDWGKITGRTVERLRAAKITPVPDHIVALAQASFDADEVKEFDFAPLFKDEAQAITIAGDFAKHMKNAGNFVKSDDGRGASVSVVIGPEDLDESGNRVKLADTVVRWKAGKRRGRAAS